METLFVLILLIGIGRLLFDNNKKTELGKEREKQTFLKYPRDGYGLDDDPVMDELFFLDIMEDDD